MRKLLPLALIAFTSLLSSGCIVVDKQPRHGHTRSAVKSCPPSQHWDGHQCRHNGRGHGARKHDNRNK